jgi:hypothetical protein
MVVLLIRLRYFVQMIINFTLSFDFGQVLVEVPPLEVEKSISEDRTQLKTGVEIDIFFTANFD